MHSTWMNTSPRWQKTFYIKAKSTKHTFSITILNICMVIVIHKFASQDMMVV